MHRSVLLVVLGLSVGVAGMGCNDATKDQTVFQAQLSPANEVPAHATGASGTAGITLEGTTVRYAIEVSGISGITASHIHSGPVGVNGPVRVFLFHGPTTGAVAGRLVEGSFTAADVTGISFDQLLSEMRSGNAYVNVHTTVYPAGEIRGQTVIVR